MWRKNKNRRGRKERAAAAAANWNLWMIGKVLSMYLKVFFHFCLGFSNFRIIITKKKEEFEEEPFPGVSFALILFLLYI